MMMINPITQRERNDQTWQHPHPPPFVFTKIRWDTKKEEKRGQAYEIAAKCEKEQCKVAKDSLLSRASPMKRGRICSILHQYNRKDLDDHLPCFITIQGSTPERRRCVVPPIRKL